MRGSLLLLAPLLCVFFAWVSTTSAQAPTDSTQDSCSSVYSYFQSHPSCYIYDYDYDTHEEGCSAFYCSWNGSFIDVNVEECQDPVAVAVHYDSYGDYSYEDYDYSDYVEFQYVYNQSETVDNYGQGDTGRYSGILARNASHLGFQLYVDHSGQDRQTLVDPVYFPLLPGECMCDSMQAVAEDIDLLVSSSCNTTNDECTELLCNLEGGSIERVTMRISQCDNPPTLTLEMVVNGQSYPTDLTGNRTSALGDLGATVIYTVWYYDYSMDIQIVAQNGGAYYEILSRHKIILDLTSCGPPRPLDLSTAPPPTIEFTEPTIPSTTDSSYDTCAALQSISIADGTLCNTNQACTALECEILSQRLEIQVDQCHNPPGIIIILYNKQNQPVFNRTFNNGSTIVNDGRLPVDLNVTVKQLPPSAISVEVYGIIRSPISLPFPDRITIVPKTVVPIDKSSCFTLAPPTTAPTSTCSAMRYIQTALSRFTVDPCYYPVANNCSTLTCAMGNGEDITLRILRCAHPPAVRITLGTAFSTAFDHTFDHSEVVPLQGVPDEGAALNVTLDQLCSSNSIGLEVDYKYSSRNAPLIPYTVIPINTTGCGPGSGATCLPTSPPDSGDLCKAMNDISDQITMDEDETECSVSRDCKEVDCNVPAERVSFSMTLKCSPVGITLTFVNSSTSPPVTESGFFNKSGPFMDIYLVTVDGKTSKGFGFAVTIHIEAQGFILDVPFVNRTYIPTTSCSSGTTAASGTPPASGTPTASGTPAASGTPTASGTPVASGTPAASGTSAASGTPVALVTGLSVGVTFVVLLTLVIIIVVITVVYLMRRRRYRHYQLHEVTMSQIDEDEPA